MCSQFCFSSFSAVTSQDRFDVRRLHLVVAHPRPSLVQYFDPVNLTGSKFVATEDRQNGPRHRA